jgi:hypothetical protein
VSGADGQGIGGGLYIGGGTACLSSSTRFVDNSASTSDDDVFGPYTVCP